MPEKSIEEMFEEIQQVLMENTNKLSEMEETPLTILMTDMSIDYQRKFFQIKSSYDDLKALVKEFHNFVLKTRV